MNILLLARRIPSDNTQDGEDLRVYHLVKGLAHNHAIHLITYGPNSARNNTVAGLFKQVHFVPEQGVPHSNNRVWTRLAGALSPHKLYPQDARIARLVMSVLANQRIDLIWIPSWQWVPYSECVGPVPVLIDVMDDGVLEYWRELRHSRSFTELAIKSKRLIGTLLFEREYFSRAALCCVVAENDARVLQRVCPKTRVAIIPNGVDADFYSPLGLAEEEATLIFEGNMNFVPNVDAAHYFCSAVLPLIISKNPRVKLYIVGKNPAPEVRRLASEHVIVTGYVDDVRPYLDRASLFVCPMRKGAGIKNKILQAWAMAKPVIATSIASDGLKESGEPNIVVADKPAEFAARTLELLSDAGERRALAKAGRETVLRYYSWKQQVELMNNAFMEIVNVTA